LWHDHRAPQNPIVTRTVDTDIRRLREKLGSKEQFVNLRMSSLRLRLPYEPVSGLPGSSLGESVRFDIDANKLSGFLLILASPIQRGSRKKKRGSIRRSHAAGAVPFYEGA
jgi:hypothetical protein